VTRQNDRDLHTDRGVAVRNRATWTIDKIHRDGSIDAHGTDGNIRLPYDYVQAAVQLGYAQTIHGAQGLTVDRSILLVDTPMDGRGIYVGLTRGVQSNDAIVLAEGNKTGTDVLATALAHDWTDRPATSVHIELVEQALAHGYALDPLTGAGWTGPGLTVTGGTVQAPASRDTTPQPPTPPPPDIGISLGL
jgi:hypothetical protein